MKKVSDRTRWTAGLLLAALALTTLAPTAEAGHAYGHYKHRSGSWHGAPQQPQRVIVEHRSSNAGPVLAGFLGGLFVGSILQSHSQHAVATAQYGYEDPYGGERFSSFDECDHYIVAHRHPRVVRVIEIRSGECVDRYAYQNGDWRQDDRYRDDRDDRGDRDNRGNDNRDDDRYYGQGSNR